MHSPRSDPGTAALQRQTDRQAVPARGHQGGAGHRGGETTVWTAVPPGPSPRTASTVLRPRHGSELP